MNSWIYWRHEAVNLGRTRSDPAWTLELQRLGLRCPVRIQSGCGSEERLSDVLVVPVSWWFSGSLPEFSLDLWNLPEKDQLPCNLTSIRQWDCLLASQQHTPPPPTPHSPEPLQDVTDGSDSRAAFRSQEVMEEVLMRLLSVYPVRPSRQPMNHRHWLNTRKNRWCLAGALARTWQLGGGGRSPSKYTRVFGVTEGWLCRLPLLEPDMDGSPGGTRGADPELEKSSWGRCQSCGLQRVTWVSADLYRLIRILCPY